MRKRRLYWTLQVLGWGLYVLINLITISINPQDLGPEILRTSRIEILIQSVVLFLTSHYTIRQMIIKRDWLSINVSKIIPRILGIIIVSSTIVVTLSYLLYGLAGTTELSINVLTNAFFDFVIYIILYILWSTVYFLYHFLESYNRSSKRMASNAR